MSTEASKDLVFEEPRVPNKYGKEPDSTSPRGYWTVSEVEEVMWRIRASGGTDSTPVVFGRGERQGGTAIRAKNVEAFPIEIPERLREPKLEPKTAPSEPVDWGRRGLVLVCAAFLIPLLVAALVGVVRFAVGVIA